MDDFMALRQMLAVAIVREYTGHASFNPRQLTDLQRRELGSAATN
jgi:hypothetical protein